MTLYDQHFVFVPLWLLPCWNNMENPALAILMTPAPVKYWPQSDYGWDTLIFGAGTEIEQNGQWIMYYYKLVKTFHQNNGSCKSNQ